MAPKKSAEAMLPASNDNTDAETKEGYNYDPNQFINARSTNEITTVANRPYHPMLKVDSKDMKSIVHAALVLLFHNDNNIDDEKMKNMKDQLTTKVVTGGITNALYRISGFSSFNKDYDSVLVRIFGAEGMIDRDVETSTFAALSDCGIAPPYYGRFSNGRLEGWLDGYVPLKLTDLQVQETNEAIALNMAKLHSSFHVPDELRKWHNQEEPGLWSQLFSWMEQAKGITVYKTELDNERAKALLDLNKLEKELHKVKSGVPDDSQVGFCHNDLLPANIMRHENSGEVKLIDFEYGGVNFIAFDIANHLNEYAGGPDNDAGQTNYDLFPSLEQQKHFISTYVQAGLTSTSTSTTSTCADESKIESFIQEVNIFVLANHLYWGLWAVNQAAVEGTDEFDYLAYAVNRFNRYYETKL